MISHFVFVDLEALIPLLPNPSSLRSQMQSTLRSLPPRIQAQQDKEKDEMMGKLKDLGNSVLGKFGLSTDKSVPCPGLLAPSRRTTQLTLLTFSVSSSSRTVQAGTRWTLSDER